MPKLQPGGEATAPAAPTAAAAPAAPAVDVATMPRPVNAKGDPMSDLELLNQILHNYREARATQTPSVSRAYKTEAEQMAAETAALKAVQAPIKDLSELVKAGVIKTLPTPPAGKKFAIDPQSQQVVLVNGP